MGNLVLIAALGFTGWAEVEPVRNETRWSPFLNQIESHIHDGAGVGRANTYRDNDRVTHAHEMTHGVNSRYRNYARNNLGQGSAVYVQDGKAYIFPRLNVRLSQVASRVPGQWRDSYYRLYMVSQQQWWDDDPIYIYDEALAYRNGALVGLEYRMNRRALESLEQAAKSYRFGATLASLACSPEVDTFQNWLGASIAEAANLAESKGVNVARVRAILASVGSSSNPARPTTPEPVAAPRRVLQDCPTGNCPIYYR